MWHEAFLGQDAGDPMQLVTRDHVFRDVVPVLVETQCGIPRVPHRGRSFGLGFGAEVPPGQAHAGGGGALCVCHCVFYAVNLHGYRGGGEGF